MTTWTDMKINKMIEFSHNALKTHITIKTIYGQHTESVKDLRWKLQDNYLLPHVRKMFQSMLDYADGLE